MGSGAAGGMTSGTISLQQISRIRMFLGSELWTHSPPSLEMHRNAQNHMSERCVMYALRGSKFNANLLLLLGRM